MRRLPVLLAILTSMVSLPSGPAAAQRADTLRLADAQAAAQSRDPRARELALHRARAALRLANIAAERYPTLSLDGQAQYQSRVTEIPITLPSGGIPTPPHDTYDARVSAQERLFDPSAGARRDVERAQLAQNEAQVEVTLFQTRQLVNDAYFNAALLGARAAAVATTIADLEAQLAVVDDRVRVRAALPSDAAALRAAILQRRQDQEQLDADRRASLTVLSELTGDSIAPSTVLALPDLSGEVAAARAADAIRRRPEYAQFARSRDVLARQAEVIASQTKPRLNAFARLGYGKPGLNMLNTTFQDYWLAGVQVQWTPWTWGTNEREREAVRVQQDILRAEESAFTESIRRSTARSLATVDRLQTALRQDDEIIALREQILHETAARLRENVITTAEYVDRQTDLYDARVARVGHEVELAQARAAYLTTLGIEVR